MDNIYPKIDGYKARDYGSRDSGLSLFFLSLVFFRREKPNSGVWRHMRTLVPYERRARPARYHDVRTRSPRGYEVHAARCGRAMGVASACGGLASREPSQSPRLLCLRRLCLSRRRRRSRRTSAPSLLQTPDTPQKTRNAHQPQRQHLHASIRVQREHFRDQHRPRGRERRRDQSNRGVEVAGHGRRGAAPARRLHREGGARHLSYGASTACCSCVNLCCSACW